MSSRRVSRFKKKKTLYIFSEGKSERNYFEILKTNPLISDIYNIKNDIYHSDIFRLIDDSDSNMKILPGIDTIKVFIFDADRFENEGFDIGDSRIQSNKDIIYISRSDFEFFLDLHLSNGYYRNNNKSKFTYTAVKEIKNLTLDKIQCTRDGSSYSGFKTPKDLIIALFENKL
jgi:hypothetical protein